MWGDCGHLSLHYSIVCGVCHHLPWSSQAGGFLYHITTLGPFKRWYCCFSLIDGEGFVTWDLERGSGVARWCWLPYGCVLVIMWTLVHVCRECCVGYCHWSSQHWYVSIMCLHTVSSVSLICEHYMYVSSTVTCSSLSLCLHSIEIFLHFITGCTWLVPSKPYFNPWVKYMPLFLDQSIVSMVSVLVLCIACVHVCTNFMPVFLMQGRCTWCSSVVTQLLDC